MPNGQFFPYVGQLLTTGSEYAERLGAWKLPAIDAWMGTYYYIFLKLIYGAAAVTHLPQKL
jgi:hypothetical protein